MTSTGIMSLAGFVAAIISGYLLSGWLSARGVKDAQLKGFLFAIVCMAMIGYWNGSLGWAVDGEDCYGIAITSTC